MYITCTLLSNRNSLGIYSPNLDIPPHQPPMTIIHLLEIGDYIYLTIRSAGYASALTAPYTETAMYFRLLQYVIVCT